MAPEAIGGSIVHSRRGLLALGWHFVALLTILAFVSAFLFAGAQREESSSYYYNDDNGNNQNSNDGNGRAEAQEEIQELSLTSKAMAFTALWTAIISIGMTAWGTVLLGVQSLAGQYYSCCTSAVHKTTPMALGGFIGALFMFANLTLICSVLFREFHIRDYVGRDEMERYLEDNEEVEEEQVWAQEYTTEKKSTAFSIMCMFLTIMYALYAGLIYFFHEEIMEENAADEKLEALSSRVEGPAGAQLHPHGPAGGGYVGSKFDVRSNSSNMMA